MQNNRERFLLFIFLAALGVAGVSIGWGKFAHSLQSQKTLLERRREKLESLNRWVESKDSWQAKGEWVAAHRPPSYTGPETEASFVQTVQASLGKWNVDIIEQRIQETKPKGRMVEVQIDLVLGASLEHLIGWLHETQGIDSYRAITHFKLKSDADNFKIRAEVSLVQLYSRPGA